MTPLEQIKKGILDGDMITVALGYKSLTGEDLHSDEANVTEVLPEFMASSQVEIDTPPSSPILSSTSNDFIAPSKKEDAEASAGRMAKSSPVSLEKRENLFVDNGSDHRDVVTPDTGLTPRQRTSFKMVSQECSKCDKTFEVHPVHKREYYICDRCIVK
jgi:hypothetical protein